ncbi:G patch domain-containing protein 1 isoform X1 [Acipenser ruthenus]|uniref:G patch domain-containing protein 1 isoform X1 n=1 Tax=Acipenser ruthenus TaxID=7906 RepID=UPI00145B5AAC|nr:G patch domain-containing protein 1 isoform X1 [Acipenser ruthenus]
MAASDSGSEDDFVTYGTPLEPLEEDEPLKKPIRLQDQTVKDEKGRFQRFHGAFTGGFSAGYFNTAGSKEGWAPSTFVSSRHQKAEKQIFKPEDFMDEEDLGEHGIAPKEIMTTDDFSSKAKDRIEEKARALAALSAPIPGVTILEDLVAAAKISVGVQLLRKMGWKEGQGVGPRVKRKPQKQKPDTDMKFYGCPLPPESSDKSENEDDDDYAPENVTFAPKDIMPIDFTPKEGLHGLGYRGLDPKQALSGGLGRGHFNVFSVGSERASSLLGDDKHRRNRKGGVLGQAFGVGALEEEDDDIYNTDSLSRYDTTLGEEEPGDGMYGWTAPQEYTKKKKGSNKDVSYIGKILEGFTLASIPAAPKKVYHPPELPRDYRPVHYFRPVLEAGSASSQVVQVLLASGGQMNQDAQCTGRHQMNAVQRRELLGETALQGPSSVFDLLSSKDKERIKELKQAAEEKQAAAAAAAAAAGRVSAQQGLSSRFQTPAVDEALSAWQNISMESASTFKPFEKNPEKQGRYDEYITQLKQGRKDALESSMDQHMTEWERGRERDEFIRAAMLYKPNNSTLACRFTRGKHEEDADKVDVPRDQENDTDDKTAAVKMKMFGKLTRDSFEWHPDKLLCKRFNIPDPYPGSSSVGMPKVKRDKYSVFNFLTVPESTMPTAQGVKPELSVQSKPSTSENASKPSEPGRRSRWDVSAQEKEGKDPISQFLSLARNEAAAEKQGSPSTSNEPEPGQKEEPPIEEKEEESRPPMDLFKAIFACSSDDKTSSSEEDSEEEEEEQKKPEEDPGLRQTTEPPVQETLPDTIQVTQPRTEDAPSTHSLNPSQDQRHNEEEFGPRLPPSISTGQERSLSVTPGSAVHEKHKKKCKEKHKAKKEHKHKKEKKKKKHKKHKHKGKHKKKKAEESSSSTDDSDDSDMEASLHGLSPGELLKRLKSLPPTKK